MAWARCVSAVRCQSLRALFAPRLTVFTPCHLRDVPCHLRDVPCHLRSLSRPLRALWGCLTLLPSSSRHAVLFQRHATPSSRPALPSRALRRYFCATPRPIKPCRALFVPYPALFEPRAAVCTLRPATPSMRYCRTVSPLSCVRRAHCPRALIAPSCVLPSACPLSSSRVAALFLRYVGYETARPVVSRPIPSSSRLATRPPGPFCAPWTFARPAPPFAGHVWPFSLRPTVCRLHGAAVVPLALSTSTPPFSDPPTLSPAVSSLRAASLKSCVPRRRLHGTWRVRALWAVSRAHGAVFESHGGRLVCPAAVCAPHAATTRRCADAAAMARPHAPQRRRLVGRGPASPSHTVTHSLMSRAPSCRCPMLPRAAVAAPRSQSPALPPPPCAMASSSCASCRYRTPSRRPHARQWRHLVPPSRPSDASAALARPHRLCVSIRRASAAVPRTCVAVSHTRRGLVPTPLFCASTPTSCARAVVILYAYAAVSSPFVTTLLLFRAPAAVLTHTSLSRAHVSALARILATVSRPHTDVVTRRLCVHPPTCGLNEERRQYCLVNGVQNHGGTRAVRPAQGVQQDAR
ncbi:hypothetical protein DENSPDRAFT_886655 [Dentipellis sp. KUC8613]|nr:hypothetical protein DENSPDRAFT_886655 [Dentipellis sp. KUC8613]